MLMDKRVNGKQLKTRCLDGLPKKFTTLPRVLALKLGN